MEEIMELSEDAAFKEEIAFTRYKYPEIKDLLKQFLTLISASLIFSVTFSDKIIDFTSSLPLHKVLTFCSWGILIIALGACGLGIYLNYIAFEIAIDNISERTHKPFQATLSYAYFFQNMSAFLFGLGMALLVGVAIVKQFR